MEENMYFFKKIHTCASVMLATIFPLNTYLVKVIFKVQNNEKEAKTLSLFSSFKKLTPRRHFPFLSLSHIFLSCLFVEAPFMPVTYFDAGVTIGFVDDGSDKKSTEIGTSLHLEFSTWNLRRLGNHNPATT